MGKLSEPVPVLTKWHNSTLGRAINPQAAKRPWWAPLAVLVMWAAPLAIIGLDVLYWHGAMAIIGFIVGILGLVLMWILTASSMERHAGPDASPLTDEQKQRMVESLKSGKDSK